MNKERLLLNFVIALESVAANKVRSFLTALGIIFGVSAVITMLAIGKGAEKEIMDQMELVGVNNINITSFTKQQEGEISEGESNAKDEAMLSPGLTLSDVKNIEKNVPGIVLTSPEIILNIKAIRKGMWRTTQLIGVQNSFFEIFNFELEQGKLFSQKQLTNGIPVCIIGNEIKKKFFNEESPIGHTIKCNGQWLTVVGILEEKNISKKSKSDSDLGIRNYNMDIYVPIQTMLVRYRNRAKIQLNRDTGLEGSERKNYNQLDKLVIKVKKGYSLSTIAQIISKVLKRRHLENIDYKITIPELLLKQQQKAKKMFSVVLGAIAGISLLVGGIGIMNIMLASVLERIKEIGLRIALGARQKDIIQQFLLESVTISISGGLLGVIIGALMSLGISVSTGITTIITFSSILLSFGVAVSIGLIFGIMPAKKAAQQNPINSLRHE
ncbi:ABC transporter permease [Bacteroidales bacterium]|nr:ABC transporter permease [Bacteroidales bacterium]